jgi:hypothetical protein
VMSGDRAINQIAAQRPQPRQRSLLVGAGEPTIADNVGDQDCSKLAFPPWRTLWASLRIARKPARSGVYSCLTCALASIAANSVCA